MFINNHLSELLKVLNIELKAVEQIDSKTLRFDDVQWAGLYNYISVNGTLKRIESVNQESNLITFTGDVLKSDTIRLPEPTLFVGSRMVTSSEFHIYSNDYNEKLPMLWLNFPSNISLHEPEKSLGLNYDELWKNLRLFFIADSDREQWTSKETLEFRTEVLTKMARYFIKNISYPYKVSFKDDIATYKFLPIFGIETEKGAIKEIIEGNLSAVFIDFNLYFNNC